MAIQRLRTLTGSSVRVSRDQVVALRTGGMTLDDINDAIEQHAAGCADAWEWKRKIQALNGKLESAKPKGATAADRLKAHYERNAQ